MDYADYDRPPYTLTPVLHSPCGGQGCPDCIDGEQIVPISDAWTAAQLLADNIRAILNTYDMRVTGRIGADHLFTDRCDDCGQPAEVLITTTTTAGRGATSEGYILCHTHAIETTDALTLTDCDEIAVTIPARLIDALDGIAA